MHQQKPELLSSIFSTNYLQQLLLNAQAVFTTVFQRKKVSHCCLLANKYSFDLWAAQAEKARILRKVRDFELLRFLGVNTGIGKGIEALHKIPVFLMVPGGSLYMTCLCRSMSSSYIIFFKKRNVQIEKRCRDLIILYFEEDTNVFVEKMMLFDCYKTGDLENSSKRH